MPPLFECDSHCHSTRIRLYITYSVFLGALILLLVIHFVVFLVRRKSKYEAKEYATRKHELVSSGYPEILKPEDKDITSCNSEDDISSVTSGTENVAKTRRPRSPSISDSATGGQDMAPHQLKRIEEEPSTGNEEVGRPRSSRRISSASTATSTSRNRSVSEALQEPVIVTVATVSALFQNELNDKVDRRGSDGSSVIDISDLVNSPGCSVRVATKEDNWNHGMDHEDHAISDINHGINQYQRLDVRVGGGSFSKRHFNNLRVGESLNTDAIFPAERGNFADGDNNR